MSRKRIHILLAAALLLIGAQVALARTSRLGNQRSEMWGLALAVEMYRDIEGEYPITDANRTWYEKLRDDAYLSATANESVDGSQPLDLYYKQPLILVPPSAANGNQIVIRAVGPNGVDDGGAHDDWDSNAEPNIGYWYKTGWLAAERWAWVCGVLAILGTVLILWRVRQGVSRVALVTLWWGVLGAVIAPRAYHFGIVGSTGGTDPPWMGLVMLLGIICVAISLLAAVEAVIVHFQTYRYPLGHCRKCRYDLRGATADQGTCPECGEPFTLTARNDEDARPQRIGRETFQRAACAQRAYNASRRLEHSHATSTARCVAGDDRGDAVSCGLRRRALGQPPGGSGRCNRSTAKRASDD